MEVPDKPWMDHKEINLILNILSPKDIMLEWGCGGSTILFSQKVKEYYSIEHHKEWYEQVIKKIKDKNFKNIHNYFVPSEVKNPIIPSKKEDYKTYIEYPKVIGKKYDKILIDGRARQFCAEFCIPYLNEGGLVFFHDFWMQERGRYREIALKYFDEVASIVTTSQTLVVLKPKHYIP
jgi:hypothetical protein